jgi:hypothetical protein
MTKNYFTDEQVKKLGWDNCNAAYGKLDTDIRYEFTEEQLKALMNLAVEVAIGEPVAYTIESELYGASYNTGLFWPKDCNHVPERANISLYSVKELEN